MNHSVGLPDQAARVSTLPVRTKSAADTIRSSGENVSALAISHISCHYLLRQIGSAAGPADAILPQLTLRVSTVRPGIRRQLTSAGHR
jgi:hypothetical protein